MFSNNSFKIISVQFTELALISTLDVKNISNMHKICDKTALFVRHKSDSD